MNNFKKVIGGSDVVAGGSVGEVYKKVVNQKQALERNLNDPNKPLKENVPIEIVDPAEVSHVNQEQEYLFSLSR